MLPAFFKTTVVKLTIIYMLIFVVFALVTVGYIAYTAGQRLQAQLDETIALEISSLQRHYQIRGIRGLLDQVQNRSRQPGAPALLVTNFQGLELSGNIPDLPPNFLSLDRGEIHSLPYDRTNAAGEVEKTIAMVQIFDLPGGFNLVIGRDVGEREEFARIISGFVVIMLVALVLLGFVSWFLVARRVLRRIDRMSETSQKIVAGNLSERLAIEGSGDEFDRLSTNVNDMLDRIEALMLGLKDVSDNIAHDLKTPLTRMRNRVETALASNGTKKDLKEALEGTIAESDHLIRTFDALLRIARVEAGSSIGTDDEVNLASVMADIVELYEPVAEDAGVTLSMENLSGGTVVKGNRELLSQALANLVDNAIKYTADEKRNDGEVLVRLERDKDKASITVLDNGPGIPAKDYEKVTKRFTRLDASRTKSGSGLGLSLVAAVAKLHAGDLSFADAKPGLQVSVRLPIRMP